MLHDPPDYHQPSLDVQCGAIYMLVHTFVSSCKYLCSDVPKDIASKHVFAAHNAMLLQSPPFVTLLCSFNVLQAKAESNL
jgi:hypothetical protein